MSGEPYQHAALSSTGEAESDTLRDEFLTLMVSYEEALQRGEGVEPTHWLGQHYPVPKELRTALEELYWLYRANSLKPAALPVPGGFPEIPGYEILEVLGHGGMAVVYQARQLRPERLVALKMIPVRALAAPEEVVRFRTEPEAVARLQHPNIVPVYQVGEHDGQPFFAMEYVDGGSLDQRLAGAPQPARPAARLVEVLAHAVQYAHEHNVVHRDLKPANILLQKSEIRNPKSERDRSSEISNFEFRISNFTPKLADFGLAKRLDVDLGQTQSGAVLGTPSYMAPEQARGNTREVGPLVDVYALGVLLYELLTGRPPFKGASVLETLEQVQEAEPAPPRLLNPQVPRDLETICLKCLRKEPARRYASAAELAEDLRRFQAGEPIRARPVRVWERVLKWMKRRPGTAGLVVAASLLVLAAATIWWYEDRTRQAESVAAAERASAEAQGYYALVNDVRAISSTRHLGWTWKGLDLLHEAAGKPLAKQDRLELRQLAATCLTGVDLKEIGSVADGMNVSCLAFSPDGQRLAVAEFKNTWQYRVRIYEVATWKLQEFKLQDAPLQVSRNGVRSLAFSPDGRLLIAGTRIGRIYAWDLSHTPPRQSRWRECHQAEVTGLAFHPDGKRLVSSSADRTIKVWQPEKGVLLDTHSFAEAAVEVNLVLGGGTVGLLGSPQGQGPLLVASILIPRRAVVDDVAFSPDRKLLACTSAYLGLHLLNAQQLLADEPSFIDMGMLAGPQAQVCFSPEGRSLATVVSGSHLILLQPEAIRGQRWGSMVAFRENKGSASREFPMSQGRAVAPAHQKYIHHLYFSPTGSLVVSGGEDRQVKIWDVATGGLLAAGTLGGQNRVYPVFSPDGRLLATTGPDKVTLHEVGGLDVRTTIASQPHPIQAMGLDPQGKTLACIASESNEGTPFYTGELSLWNVQNGARLLSVPRDWQGIAAKPPRAHSVTFHPKDGTLLCQQVNDVDGLQLWDVAQQRRLERREAVRASFVAFGRDGRRLWGAVNEEGRPGRVLSWTWPELKVASEWSNLASDLTRPRSGIFCIAAGRDWVLAGSGDEFTKLLRSNDGQRLVRQWQSPGGTVECVTLNAEETLAASGTADGHVQVVRVPAGDPVMVRPNAHQESVSAIALDSEGKLLVTGSHDRTLRLWRRDGTGFTPLVTLPASGPVASLLLTPDGKTLVVLIENERAVRVWHLDRLNERLTQLGLDGQP